MSYVSNCMLVLYVFLCISFCKTVDDDTFKFAVISDTHLEPNVPAPSLFLSNTVEFLNRIKDSENIKVVFVIGDLTDKATSFAEVKSILSNLKIPYIPMLGNHDIMVNNASWAEPVPTGDLIFVREFREQFEKMPGLQWQNKETFNPSIRASSWFPNFRLKIGRLVFLGVDYASRTSGRNWLFNGVFPRAELHDFPGGTLPWLEGTLKDISKDDISEVVLLQHYPFRLPFARPEFLFGFSGEDKQRIADLLIKYLPKDKIFGMLCGHMHRFFNGTALDQIQEWRQWETDANKKYSVITIGSVLNGKLVDLRERKP